MKSALSQSRLGGFIICLLVLMSLTSCSRPSNCTAIKEVSSQIAVTLQKVVSNPGNSYNLELANHIKSLSTINGSSEFNQTIKTLRQSIESLMTTLNSGDLREAGKSVSAMTTSIQILTTSCNSLP
jgi:hypothetical protein